MTSRSGSATGSAAARSLTRFAWLSIGAALATLTLKSVAAAMTGSVGLLSDAAESIVNLVAAVVALLALRIAARPPDEGHNFGHGKTECFSAVLAAVVIHGRRGHSRPCAVLGSFTNHARSPPDPRLLSRSRVTATMSSSSTLRCA